MDNREPEHLEEFLKDFIKDLEFDFNLENLENMSFIDIFIEIIMATFQNLHDKDKLKKLIDKFPHFPQ